MLRRVLARSGAHGVGVDRSAPLPAEARARLATLAPPASATLHEGAIEDFADERGGFDLVINVGAIPDGGYRAMLRALKGCARPGGLVLVGDGVLGARAPGGVPGGLRRGARAVRYARRQRLRGDRGGPHAALRDHELHRRVGPLRGPLRHSRRALRGGAPTTATRPR
jgi:hypothetical protein